MRERIQPQALGLIEQLGIFKTAVILVVIIDPEQCKYLIDRIDMRIGWCRLFTASISLPSCGR
jgi:hypothetical protein